MCGLNKSICLLLKYFLDSLLLWICNLFELHTSPSPQQKFLLCPDLSIECAQIVLIAVVKLDDLWSEGRICKVVFPHASRQNSGYLLILAADQFAIPVLESLKSAKAAAKKFHVCHMVEAAFRPCLLEHLETLTVARVPCDLLKQVLFTSLQGCVPGNLVQRESLDDFLKESLPCFFHWTLYH